jgi:hypothetical protein
MAKIARIDDYSNPLILFYDLSKGCNCAVGGGIVDQDMFIIDIFNPSHRFPDALAQFFNVLFLVITWGEDTDIFQVCGSPIHFLQTTRHDLLFQLF